MKNSEPREEEGDEKCPVHLWYYYLDEQNQEKYRECRRCWRIQVREKEHWKDKRIW